VSEKRNTQYEKVFSIFENSKSSIAKVTASQSKQKVPCQDVTSSVTNRCDVPEVITSSKQKASSQDVASSVMNPCDVPEVITSSKQKTSFQDVASSVTNPCDVPEVITIPESPCQSPVCIPESEDERCSSPIACQGDKNPKGSIRERENESGTVCLF
jgi:hypothetical protein